MSDENPNAFKLWINGAVVEKYFSTLDLSNKEISKITNELEAFELRGRVQLIAKKLKEVLPADYPKALQLLLKTARAQKLKSFELWPTTEFIQIYGLEHIDESLEAMYELTQKFTAEFCIRPFINQYGDVIYKKIMPWKKDSNEHIRRWLSEGTRPRLPWGEKLHSAVKDPKLGLQILEHLKYDSSLYVRKSVANHLNDIAKDHPELVVKTLTSWKKQVPKNYEKEFSFISSRALRTLIKDGHSGALKFSGVDLDQKNITCTPIAINKNTIKLNEKIEFKVHIKNNTNKNIKFILDYVIYFKKANGTLSPKVFKLKTGLLAAHEKLSITKNHSIKPITTRTYHAGEHKIAIKVNGQELSAKKFVLSLR